MINFIKIIVDSLSFLTQSTKIFYNTEDLQNIDWRGIMKKIALSLLLVVIAFTVGGCPFFTTPEHRRAHRRAIDRNMEEIHRFTDRYFWDYDWEDPNNY